MESPTQPERLTIGDTVTWSSQAQGYRVTKTGTVMEVVRVGDRPDRNRFPSLYSGAGAGFGRKAESYVIEVPGKTPKHKARLYWPIASLLAKAGGAK